MRLIGIHTALSFHTSLYALYLAAIFSSPTNPHLTSNLNTSYLLGQGLPKNCSRVCWGVGAACGLWSSGRWPSGSIRACMLPSSQTSSSLPVCMTKVALTCSTSVCGFLTCSSSACGFYLQLFGMRVLLPYPWHAGAPLISPDQRPTSRLCMVTLFFFLVQLHSSSYDSGKMTTAERYVIKEVRLRINGTQCSE